MNEKIVAAQKILTDKGWKLGEDNIFIKETKSGKKTETQRLSFSISTSNIPELKKTAEILKDTWTKLGADVSVQIFEPSDLTQKVIRPRKYDSLLFGNVIGRDLDIYPFWHSSERNDPGLNIALYTNLKADKALETLRNTSDESKRQAAFDTFRNEVSTDIPAIFLYSPGYIYATNKYVQNIQLQNMTSISERFMNIDKWYMHTERIWKIFVQDKN
jgi:peptide/nickel transport system substrate-binding protein